MRADINLDDDVYSFATSFAGVNGITLSAAINELLRIAERAHQPIPALLMESRLGLLVRARQADDVEIAANLSKELSEDDPA